MRESTCAYIIKDDTLKDILCFFDDVESNDKLILTENDAVHSDPLNPTEPTTAASEARQLKDIFIKLCALSTVAE